MKQSVEFAQGVAYALQTIKDFEEKHGHLHLDAITANSLSNSMREVAIIFYAGQFYVVRRKLPHGRTYEFIEQQSPAVNLMSANIKESLE